MTGCTPRVVSRETVIAAAENFVADHLAPVRAADRQLAPSGWLLCPGRLDAALFPDYDEALAWSGRNAGMLAATVHTAHEMGLHEQIRKLCDALGTAARQLLCVELRRAAHELGVASAAQRGSTPHALMLTCLGACHQRTGDLEQAGKALMFAGALWKQAGNRAGLALTRPQLGRLSLRRGDVPVASAQLGRALRGFANNGLHREMWLVHRRLVRSSVSLARVHTGAGHHDQELGVLTSAVEVARTRGLVARAGQVQALTTALISNRPSTPPRCSVSEQGSRS